MMSKTAITPAIVPTAVSVTAPAAGPRPEPQIKRTGVLFTLLTPLASLRLTVVLFVLSFILIFLGTLAQMNAGIWTVVKEYFRSWGLVWVPFQLFVQLGQVFFSVSREVSVPGSFPFPGGWLLGALLLANLLAAHAIRFRISWKRSGILILHSGLIVMMLGEFVTGQWANEAHMTIDVNGSSNFVEDHRFSELAIISPAGPKEDNVVVVPERFLRGEDLIQNEQLPFDVEPVRYMVNSVVVAAEKAPPGTTNPAQQGIGKDYVALEKPEGTGVSQDAKNDVASAYVTFRKKGTGEPLGTYLVSVWLALNDMPQQVSVEGKTYEVYLRWKRTYKPYTLYLHKLQTEYYPGTRKPKDFSSYVRLVDSSRSEDREVRIWMNHPLSYAGETFYQSSVIGADKATVLQVVGNPGWVLPYLSCGMVAFGLLLHFGLKLTEFLRKTLKPTAPRQAAAAASRPGRPGFWSVPGAIVGLAGLFLIVQMLPPHDASSKPQVQEAARLPVMENGRIKPLDTVARTNLMLISGKQEFTDEEGHTQPAIKWLLDVMTSAPLRENAPALKHKVFRIENLEVLNLLGLPQRKGYRYAISEFGSKLGKIKQEARRAEALTKDRRDRFDVKILELDQHLGVYAELMNQAVLLVPPLPGGEGSDWTTLWKAEQEAQAGGRENPAAVTLDHALDAYARGETHRFNDELAAYHKQLEQELPSASGKAGLEVFFNNFAPFYQCAALYVGVLLLACLSWLGWREWLRRSAFWLLVLTLAVHTWALCTRMYLQGRPPVTNLYSSAVFIGWGCVILGLVLEYLFRVGIGAAVGAVLGFISVFLSHYFAAGDTMPTMEPVLDTNFWLATHVTCVTLGYTATLVAGILGITYLFARAGHWLLNPQAHFLAVQDGTGKSVDLLRIISQMTYGILCFATLLSFVGTVLGGLWADYSWGRFWGWDPKENGALLIVIWNALILHARWAGLVKGPGMARLAVVGNMVVGWSWIGTNQLGVGLHAYGFDDNLAVLLRWWWIINVVILGVEALTLIDWRKLVGPRPQAA
jgi:ABC-type transport system involved in cytochrome c biogenesis permease subunit